jgi:hypothetical protein
MRLVPDGLSLNFGPNKREVSTKAIEQHAAEVLAEVAEHSNQSRLAPLGRSPMIEPVKLLLGITS